MLQGFGRFFVIWLILDKPRPASEKISDVASEVPAPNSCDAEHRVAFLRRGKLPLWKREIAMEKIILLAASAIAVAVVFVGPKVMLTFDPPLNDCGTGAC